MKFEDLTNPQLKKVIKNYKLHLLDGITGYSTFDREKLIRICNRFFDIDEEKIKPKVVEPIFFDIPAKPEPRRRVIKTKEVKVDNSDVINQKKKLQRNIEENERKIKEQEMGIDEKVENINKRQDEIRNIKKKKKTEKKIIPTNKRDKGIEQKLTPEDKRKVRSLIRTYNRISANSGNAYRRGYATRQEERDSERIDDIEEKIVKILKPGDNDWETIAEEMGLM
jgi:hypothetical protein